MEKLTNPLSQVASAPLGTQAATLDIEAAYRTVPVWPPHKCFLAVAVGDKIFIDHVFPFGLTTAGGVQGSVADPTVDILHSPELGPIKKWVDDHTFFRFACRGGETLPDELLGVPWHPRKWQDFAFIFIYLSFLWNLINCTVELPEVKRTKYLGKLFPLLESVNHGN